MGISSGSRPLFDSSSSRTGSGRLPAPSRPRASCVGTFPVGSCPSHRVHPARTRAEHRLAPSDGFRPTVGRCRIPAITDSRRSVESCPARHRPCCHRLLSNAKIRVQSSSCLTSSLPSWQSCDEEHESCRLHRRRPSGLASHRDAARRRAASQGPARAKTCLLVQARELSDASRCAAAARSQRREHVAPPSAPKPFQRCVHCTIAS